MADFEKDSTGWESYFAFTTPKLTLKRIPQMKESFIDDLPDKFLTKYELQWSVALWVLAIVALLLPASLAYRNTGEFSFVYLTIGAVLAAITIFLHFSEKKDNEFQVSQDGIKNWKLNILWSDVAGLLEVNIHRSRSFNPRKYIRFIFNDGEFTDVRIKFDDDRKVLTIIKAYYQKQVKQPEKNS